MKSSQITAHFLTEQGKRKKNEDSIYPGPETKNQVGGLFLVCDGVGGEEKGEIASELACKKFAEFFILNPPVFTDETVIRTAVKFVEEAFDNYITDHPQVRGMATTVSLLHFHSGGATLAHIGDSRIYHFRDGVILNVTKDHSWVNHLIDTGQLNPEDAETHPQRNVITRAIQGKCIRETLADVKLVTDIRKGDYFFICSDGILESYSEENLAGLISSKNPDEEKIAEIKLTCGMHSNDNFSAILINVNEVKELPDPKIVTQPLSQNIPNSNGNPEKFIDKKAIRKFNPPIVQENQPLKEEIVQKPKEPVVDSIPPFPTITRPVISINKKPLERKRKRNTRLYATIGILLILVLVVLFWQNSQSDLNTENQKQQAELIPKRLAPPPVAPANNIAVSAPKPIEASQDQVKPQGEIITQQAPVREFAHTFHHRGNSKIDPEDYQIYKPLEGISKVISKKTGKCGYIEALTGIPISDIKYDDAVEWFSNGCAWVRLNGKWGYIDKTGLEFIKLQYQEAYPFKEDMAAVKKDGKWGFIYITGKNVIPFIYDLPESSDISFNDDLARVKLNGKDIYIDKTGKKVKDAEMVSLE